MSTITHAANDQYALSMSAREYHVWLIDEGQTGHLVQSEGILQALQQRGFAISVEKIYCHFRLRGLLRPPARAIFSVLDPSRAVRFANRISPFSEPSGPPPSFIVSSGGRSAFVSRALALQTKVPNVFIGSPRPFPFNWFRVVLSPVPLPPHDAILTGVLPNLMTPDSCAAQSRSYWLGAPPSKRWTMLIGGPRTRDHLYQAEDWRNIAAGINALARRYGIKWLITTSRRTGSEAEAILESTLRADAVEELVLFGHNPRRVSQAFLGAAEKAFVTRDSLTMVSEAILSGRPVTALLPRHVGLPARHFMAKVFRSYASCYRYAEIPCSELADFDAGEPGDATIDPKAMHELQSAANKLARELRI